MYCLHSCINSDGFLFLPRLHRIVSFALTPCTIVIYSMKFMFISATLLLCYRYPASLSNRRHRTAKSFAASTIIFFWRLLLYTHKIVIVRWKLVWVLLLNKLFNKRCSTLTPYMGHTAVQQTPAFARLLCAEVRRTMPTLMAVSGGTV